MRLDPNSVYAGYLAGQSAGYALAVARARADLAMLAADLADEIAACRRGQGRACAPQGDRQRRAHRATHRSGAELGRALVHAQMSGFGGEAEFLCSTRALPVLTLSGPPAARWSLLDQLEIPRLPRLIEPRLQRTVKTQHHVPTLAGHRLNPVGFVVGRSFRTEPNRYRPVRIFLEPRRGTIDTGQLLVCLQQRARLIVVDHERPEFFCGDRCWQRDLVRLTAVEVVALRILHRHRIG